MNHANVFSTPLINPSALSSQMEPWAPCCIQRGVTFDECFDALNLTKPALVGEVHREYIEAGSQIIQTNTFGANRYQAGPPRAWKTRSPRSITAGVELARRVILASFKTSPHRRGCRPAGRAPGALWPGPARAGPRRPSREQIAALVEAGVDLLIIETMTDLFEINEAIQAAREVAPDLPVVASMTFTRDDRTLLGDRPGQSGPHFHAGRRRRDRRQLLGRPQPDPAHPEANARRPCLRRVSRSCPTPAGPNRSAGASCTRPRRNTLANMRLSFWRGRRQPDWRLLRHHPAAHPSHVPGDCSHSPAGMQPDNGITHRHRPRTKRSSYRPNSPPNWPKNWPRASSSIAVEMDPPRGLSTHKITGRRQPAGRSRRGCDQRGRQPHGAHAHEPLGGLQPDPAQSGH